MALKEKSKEQDPPGSKCCHQRVKRGENEGYLQRDILQQESRVEEHQEKHRAYLEENTGDEGGICQIEPKEERCGLGRRFGEKVEHQKQIVGKIIQYTPYYSKRY